MVKEGGKIAQHLDLIAGLPEEDYESFRKTFNDVFAMRPEELQLGFLKLLRGTGLRIDAEKYGYTYVDYAPYEILSNNVLSFDDIIRIKQAEDVLEKYWNAHRMDHTIEYLVTEVFETPFDFFQSFGTFWEEKGWSRIGHQLEDLFTRLDEFLRTLPDVNLGIVHSLMKLDFLSKQQFHPRKLWWEERISKEELKQINKLINEMPEIVGEEFAKMKVNEKELVKHSLIVPFNMDYEEYTKGNIVERDTYLFVYFRQGENPYFATFPKSIIQERTGQNETIK